MFMHYLTISMEQNVSWGSSISSVNQEIPTTLRKPKFHLPCYKTPPLYPIDRQMEWFHKLFILFLNIPFNIILSSLPVVSKWSISFSLPRRNTGIRLYQILATLKENRKKFPLLFTIAKNNICETISRQNFIFPGTERATLQHRVPTSCIEMKHLVN
jgi:hypothetical protein